MSEGVNITNFR